MLGFKYNFGYGGVVSGVKPLINYSWSNTYQVNNQMYSKNLGSGADLQLYSGQGWKNNGVDHDLGLSDIGATSMIYTLDGVQTYTETPFYSFLGLGGIWKDLYYFNRELTQVEIIKYSTSPNVFFIDAEQDNTCVLNMPLAEHDEICFDYAYSQTEEVVSVLDSTLSGADETHLYVKHNDTSFDLSVTVAGTSVSNPLAINNTALDSGVYLIEFDAVVNSGTPSVYRTYTDRFDVIEQTIINGKNYISILVGSPVSSYRFYWNGTNEFDISVTNYKIKKIAKLHQIENYTNSCRDEAKQLPYGSQNANYLINSLGMRTDESPYFECSELFDNYGDIGWIPSANEDWTIVLIPKRDTSKQTVDIIYGGSTSEVRFRRFLNGQERWYIGGATLNMSGLSIIDQYNVHFLTYEHLTSTAKAYTNDGTTAIESICNLIEGSSFVLGSLSGSYGEVFPIRVFEVHNKILTQAERLSIYNDNPLGDNIVVDGKYLISNGQYVYEEI